MVDVGETAPDFTLKGVHEGEVREYTLSDYTAEGTVLLGVYLYDFAPQCTSQMCQVSDIGWYQYKKNLSLFGISTDGPYSHIEFARENDIDYPLLSDTGGKVLASYGVLNDEWEGMSSVPQRSLFLVDADRTVRYKWVADDNLAADDFGLNPVQEAIKALD